MNLNLALISQTPKAQTAKEKIDKFDFIKIINFCASDEHYREWKDNTQNERKYLISDEYPDSVKQQSPTFWAPGTSFMEDNFSTDRLGGTGG